MRIYFQRNGNIQSPENVQASLEQLKGLPPALIQTAENDVLRDEGEAYARKLDEAGVPVTFTREGGLIHDKYRYAGGKQQKHFCRANQHLHNK